MGPSGGECDGTRAHWRERIRRRSRSCGVRSLYCIEIIPGKLLCMSESSVVAERQGLWAVGTLVRVETASTSTASTR